MIRLGRGGVWWSWPAVAPAVVVAWGESVAEVGAVVMADVASLPLMAAAGMDGTEATADGAVRGGAAATVDAAAMADAAAG
jgi:hypothetical protein